jgi:TfoX/Sxy family transcriptional regulator of competence genes
MAYDEGLAERIREIVRSHAGITERKMFGGLAFMARGHMFVGVLDSTLMARVGAEGYAGALARPHVRKMDFTGKPLTGYVYVAPEGFESDEALAYWVKICLAFVASLPPKRPAK